MPYNVLLAEMPLGLNLLEVLLHLLNLAVLMVAVRFLLYKPIKKFMDKRAEEYRNERESIENDKNEAEEAKAKYLGLLDNAKKEAQAVTAEALGQAEINAEKIVDKAKQKAKQMLQKADEDIDLKRVEEKEHLAAQIPELALGIASKIIERELTVEDNDAIIADIIEEWKKN